MLWAVATAGSLVALAKGIHWVLLVLSFVLVHQLGHMALAGLLGVDIGFRREGKFKIYLVGNPLERWKDFVLASGGPLFSVFFVVYLCLLFKANPSLQFKNWIKFFILINLLNLFPAYPLDGGRMYYAWGLSITKKFKYIGKIFSVLAFMGGALYLKLPLGFIIASLAYLIFGGKLPPEDVKGESMGVLELTLSALGYIFLLSLSLIPILCFL